MEPDGISDLLEPLWTDILARLELA
jgi:hypothetical protein